MSKKTGKGAKWIGNTVGRRVGKETADALKKLTREAEKKTGKKSSSSSDKVEKAARTVKEALRGVGDNAGRNIAELTSRHRGRPSGRGNTSSKMDKLASNPIKTAEKENKSFAERFREDLKDGAGSNLREARRQYKPEEDPKKELETNLEAVNRKYRNAGVGGFVNRDSNSDKFNFQSAASKQRMASTADRMIAEWDSIPENERVSVAEYIVQAYGINDKTRDIVMSAYQNADTNGKLQLLKTARYIDGESADVKKMQRMAQNAGDFEKAVESDLKNASNAEKVDDFVRNAQKAVINDYRKEEEKTKLLQDWAKDNYSFSDAIKNQIYQSGSGWLAHAYDAVVMAWSDLVMAGQQDSVFDGIDPTRGMKDVRSIGDGLATAGSNVLHDLFRIAGLPISLISKASYTEEEAREITEKLMGVTDQYHDVVRETQLKLDGSGLSNAQKDIVEVVGAVIDQVPAIVMSVAASPAAGMAVFGVEAGGMYARSAYDNGATLEDAVRFGLSAAAMEMVTEKMFTGFGYMGKGFLGEAAQDTIKNMLRSSGFENSVSANILRRVIAGGGEATEEMVMEIVQPYLERASYDPNAAGASMDEILHSGALGFVVAEILGLPANALGVANAATRKRSENQAERMVQDQIDDMMQDAIRRGKLSESEASNINAQIKDIRTKKGVLTESQAKQETKTTEDNLDRIYPDFNSARKAMQEEAKNMANGEPISAYFMQDGEVKVWRSVVTDGKIGLTQEGALTESERKSYTDKAARVASAANATERTGYQLNVRDDIVKQVSALSRAFGKEIEFVSRSSTVHGYEEGGKIYVNADSNQSPAAAVVAHEMTHMLEGTDSYAALRDMVYKHYGSSVGSKRDEILRNYENAGVTLDTTKNESGYDEVDTEVMAAFVEEKLLTDYDTILSTVKTDRTLGERILDWLERVLTRIAGTKEQRFLIDARKKWSRALEEARGESAGNTKYSVGKKEKQAFEAKYNTRISYSERGRINGKILARLENLKRKEGFEGGLFYIQDGGYIYTCNAVDMEAFDYDVLGKKLFAKATTQEIEEANYGSYTKATGNRSDASGKRSSGRGERSIGSFTGRTGRTRTAVGMDEAEEDLHVLGDGKQGRGNTGNKTVKYSIGEEMQDESSASFNLQEKVKKAQEYFGTTSDFREAGYLTTTGKLLDFSGKKFGAGKGQRSMDHREISDVYMEEDLDGGKAMIAFMNDGNIRMAPEIPGIDLSMKPNEAQEAILRRYFDRYNGYITLDVSNEYGDNELSFDYPKGTKASKIINDIRNYFDNGVEPYVSDIQRFRYSIGESEQKRIAELEASLKETKEVPVYSNGTVTFYIENSNGKYRFTKDKKNALALDRINKDKERELLSSQYKSKPLSMVRTEEVTVDARMSYDKRKGIQDEIEALKTGYANRQEMADAKNKKYQERIAADQRIAEESYFSEKERKGEPFYTDTAGFSYISALRTITAEAKRMGAEEVYASSKKGSKFSSSVYLKKDGVEVRISDHQLPDTMEREDPRYRTRWDDEIILNQSSLRELAREIKTQDDLKGYISQMFFGSEVSKYRYSIGYTEDNEPFLKVDKETRDLITAHNAAMREVFYSRSRSDQTELWNMIKDEMAHILRTGAARRKVVDEIVQLAYDTGYRNATGENEAVNTWGKGIYIPEKYMGEMASLGGLKAVNNQLMGSGLYFTYQRKKKDSNVNYGSLDEAYSDLSNANPMLPETIDPAEQVQAIIDLFSSKNRRQSLRELDEEAYEMGEDSEPYLTDIRNAVNEAMDDISTMARYKMTEAARKSGKTEGRKEGAVEQRRKQQKSDEATMREYDKLRGKIARDERRDAEATMRMHDKLIKDVRKEERKLSEKEKSDIRREVKAKEREWDKETKRQVAELKREQRRQLRNADRNLDAALREAEKERKKREKDLSDAEKKEAQKRMKEIDAERRKERIETAKEEYKKNNPPPKTGTTADLYRKNNGARKIATDFRDKAIAELVNRGVFVDTNGQVVLDENNQEVAYRSDETGKWDISKYKNSYTPSWGLTLLAKKEELDVDKFYTIYSQIMTMRTEQDDRGNHKYHKSDIVKYISTLDITAKQKNFLYFDCAKYAYSTKPNFLSGGKTKVKAGNRRGHMIEALDNIAFDMFNGTVKQEEMIDEEVNIQLRAEDITAFLDAVFGKDPSAEKEAYAEFFTKLVIDSASEMELMRMAERSNLLTDKPREISQTKSRILQIYRQSKRMFLAEGEAYERMSDDIGDKLLTARYYGAKNALAIANEMIYGNTQRDLSGINKGKSLHEIFRPVFRADEKANNHTKMIALTELVNCRHDIYRLQYDKGYTGYSIEECEEVVERISNEFPELVRVADELVGYGRSLLRMCVDSGRISEEDYQYFVEKYPYYVPTFRVRSNEYIDRKGRVVRRDTKVIRTARKSNVDVLPLFDQFVRRTQEIVKACKKNQLANELARAYTMDETRGSEEAEYNRIEKYIYNISPADKNNAGDLQSQIDEISEIGEIEDRGTSERGTENNVIPWYSNGVKYNIEIADEGLLYGWDRISYRKDEIALGTAVRKLNNIRRGVLTQYNPTFWLTNGIRDIQDMYMYNQHAQRLPRFHAIAAKTMFAGSLSGTKAAKKMTKREIDETRKNEERLQEYFSFGVRASSIFEYDKTKSGVRSRGRRAVEGVKKYTLDAFDGLNFMVEQTPRFAVYLETVDRLEKQREKEKNSYTDEEIKTIASYQATDATLNFGRSGTIVKGMNTYGFTFLNAGVQGMDRFIRSFTQIKNKDTLAVLFNLAGLAFKVLFFGFAPGFISQIIYSSSSEAADAIRRALYGDDDDEIQKIMQEYAEMADYQRVNYFLFYVGGTWYRIPRGRVLSWYNGIEFYYAKTGRDDYDTLDFISDQWDLTTETILPSNPITNNILGPLIDVWRNKDNWGNDIVSEYEDMGEGMHYLEYDEDTTDLAIRIARLGHYLTGTRFGNEFSRIIDISPKKLDYIVEQYFGSYADMIMPFLNKEQRLNDNLIGALESMAKKFYIDPNASNRLAGDYYDLKEEYERISNAYGGETPYAVASKVFNDYGDFLKEARNNIKAIENDNSLTRKERLEKISAIRKEMNQLYRDAMADAKSVLEYAQSKYGQEGVDNSKLYDEWIKENKDADWRTAMSNKTETEKLNRYRNLGMSDDTAYLVMDTLTAIKPLDGNDEVTDYQRMEAIAGLGLSPDQERAAVGAILTNEKQYEKYLAMCDHASGVSAAKWCEFKDALAAADAADDGNGYYNKDEKKAALDSCDFTNAERAVFWQSLDSKIGSAEYTTQWKAGRNPYDSSVAAKMIDSYLERVAKSETVKAAANKVIAKTTFPVGTEDCYISSQFGYRPASATNGVGSKNHKGIDISTRGKAGVPAYSAAAGEVVAIGEAGGYGNRIIIQNDDGYSVLYGHLASYASDLKVGDKVESGQQIGIVGNTGNSTGIHLHFEVRTNWEDGNSAVDPNTVYDIDGDGKLKDGSVTDAMGTGTANSSYTGSGSAKNSSGGKSGGGSKKASSSANLATALSSTQRKTTGYDSITKTASSRQGGGVYLPTTGKTVSTARSNTTSSSLPKNVRGRSTKAEGYGSGGTYLPRAKQYNAIRNRSISSSVATSKRTGRTGGSLWNENILG